MAPSKRARQKQEFEVKIKLLIRPFFEAGNDAIGLEGGDPATHGIVNDQDMAEILQKAAQKIANDPVNWLYEHEPLPKRTNRQ